MERSPEKSKLWTYNRFSAGLDFGAIDIAMDAEKHAHWAAVFGESDGQRLPRGMLIVAMMEAYIKAIQPRPDGNIHAAQKARFHQPRPCWGDTLTAAVSCAGKEERKGRYWIDFRVDLSCRLDPVMAGTIRTIWAA